jgi:hypothetical protein
MNSRRHFGGRHPASCAQSDVDGLVSQRSFAPNKIGDSEASPMCTVELARANMHGTTLKTLRTISASLMFRAASR